MSRELSRDEKVRALSLLEIERHAQLMFTSCGWFFDEVSGIETVQILQYAARAIQLAEKLSGVSLEREFIEKLRRAPSNLARYADGAGVYENLVRPSMISTARVGAHYGVSSLFENYGEVETIFSYTIRRQRQTRNEAGRQKLVTGTLRIRSAATWEENQIAFAALHLGDHNLLAGVSELEREEAFNQLRSAFERSNVSEMVRLMERHFEKHSYSLAHLFKDEKQRVLARLLAGALEDVEHELQRIYERYYPVMQMMKEMKTPPPSALLASAEFVISARLRRAIAEERSDIALIEGLIEEVKKWSFEIDEPALSLAATRKLNHLMDQFSQWPQSAAGLREAERLLKAIEPLSLRLDVWRAQNTLFLVGRPIVARLRERRDALSKEWVELFSRLAERLEVSSD